MKIENVIAELVEDLESGDTGRVDVAVERLAEIGERAVPEVLRGAAGKGPRYLVEPHLRVLGLIGPAAFDRVLAAARAGEVDRWDARQLLSAFDERCAEQYAALATGPDRSLATCAFKALERLRVDSDAGLRALLDVYGRGGELGDDVVSYARSLHESFAPRLRALRGDAGVSRSRRRAALGLLLEGAGLDGLDERDRALVERLVRVKIPGEIPDLPSPQLCSWWLAVPGAAYEGLFEVLGLHDARPVTVTAGVAAAYGEEIPVPGDPDRVAGRAFVTPELDGWRLVYGSYGLLFGNDYWNGMTDALERLSTVCGQAQLFYVDEAGGADMWFVAEDGLVIRQYVAESDPEWEGEPLPWEVRAVDDPDSGAGDDVDPDAGTDGARTACGFLSVDPDLVGRRTVVRGHGWLAVTEPDVGHGPFPGLLPV